MPSRYPDIMVDLETTGVDPARSNIIQIAAVKFNADTREVSGDTFDRCLMFMPNRFWSEDTRKWWMKQPEVLESIMNRMENPVTVLQAFREWIGFEGGIRFWGKPTHFDFSFLQSYYSDLGQPPPFHYRYANDMNSFIRGRYFPEEPPQWERILPFEGPAHDGIFDCFHQVKVLFKVLDKEYPNEIAG